MDSILYIFLRLDLPAKLKAGFQLDLLDFLSPAAKCPLAEGPFILIILLILSNCSIYLKIHTFDLQYSVF